MSRLCTQALAWAYSNVMGVGGITDGMSDAADKDYYRRKFGTSYIQALFIKVPQLIEDAVAAIKALRSLCIQPVAILRPLRILFCVI